MIKASSGDKPAIAKMLTRCFDDNKSVNYLIPQDRRRTKRIHRMMEYAFDYCRLFGDIFLSDDRQGCALVVYPWKIKTTFRSTLLDIQLILQCIGLANLRKALRREAIIKRLHPREKFCYLWFIGVLPDVQGKGIGNTLLQQLIAESDRQALPIYLETSVEKNVSWYVHSGFTTYDKLEMGYQLYCMKRAARLFTD